MTSIASAINIQSTSLDQKPERQEIFEQFFTNTRFYTLRDRIHSISDKDIIKLLGDDKIFYDEGYAVQQTVDGGYIIAGLTEFYDDFSDNYYSFAILIKTDEAGTIEWAKKFPGLGFALGFDAQQTNDNGYIVTGITTSFFVDNPKVLLIKTDENGDLEWEKTFDTPGGCLGYSVQQTADDGYIIAGFSASSNYNHSYVLLIKTDSSGNLQWQKELSVSGRDFGYSVQQTRDGGYIVGGDSLIDFENFSISKALLIKTDDMGNISWNKTYSVLDISAAAAVQQTEDDGYILTGGAATFTINISGVLLLKTDSEGNELWNQTLIASDDRESVGLDILQTDDHGYIIVGFCAIYQTLEYGTLLLKTTAEGTEEWNHTFDNGYLSYSQSIDQTQDNGYILTGLTVPSTFDDCNILLIKTNSSGDETWSKTLSWINNPPNPPLITGPTEGKAGEEYEYIFVAVDPDEDGLSQIFIIWGDGNISGIIGIPWIPSGKENKMNHSWEEQGTYTIRAQAIDIFGAESDWATLEITMPRNRCIIRSTFQRFLETLLERFPRLHQILSPLLV
jgi:hypothetical protein